MLATDSQSGSAAIYWLTEWFSVIRSGRHTVLYYIQFCISCTYIEMDVLITYITIPFLQLNSVLGTSPCRMQQALLHLLVQPSAGQLQIQEYAFIMQLIGWEGCFKSLCSFKKPKVKQSNWLPQNKALPFFLMWETLNTILLSKLGQTLAHLGHREPQRNFLTQGARPKIFMQKYVYGFVYIHT